jgi:hypothetical protein
MTDKARRPWRMFVPFFVVVGLFALWSLYWLAADRTARSAAAEARARMAADGRSLACTSESWGGYPFRFEFACKAAVLTAPGLRLTASHVLAVAQAYNPFHVVTLIEGPTTVELEGRPPVTAIHDRAILSVTVEGDRLVQLSGEVTRLAVAGQLTAADLVIHARPSAKGDYDLALDGSGLAVTPPGKPPLALNSLQFRGTFTAPRHLDIDTLAATSGAVTASASGQVELDDSHRPEGKLVAQTNDAKGLMDLVTPQLDMTDKQQTTATTLIGFLGNQPRLDIVAKDGFLYVGPMPAGRLDPLY